MRNDRDRTRRRIGLPRIKPLGPRHRRRGVVHPGLSLLDSRAGWGNILGPRRGHELMQLGLVRAKLGGARRQLRLVVAIVDPKKGVARLDFLPLLDMDLGDDSRNIHTDRNILRAAPRPVPIRRSS